MKYVLTALCVAVVAFTGGCSLSMDLCVKQIRQLEMEAIKRGVAEYKVETGEGYPKPVFQWKEQQ